MKRPSKLSRWWWSLEGHRWLVVRLAFLLVMVPVLIVACAVWAWGELWPDLKDTIRETIKGPSRS